MKKFIRAWQVLIVCELMFVSNVKKVFPYNNKHFLKFCLVGSSKSCQNELEFLKGILACNKNAVV